MSINELDMLLKFSNLINSKSDVYEIIAGVKQYFSSLKELNIFFYDYSSKKLKDAVNNFSPVEDMFDETAVGILYNKFLKLSNCDLILDGCETMSVTLKDGEDIILETVLIPMRIQGSIFGMIEITFDKKSSYKVSFLKSMIIFANQMLLWIQNKLINDRLQINSDFYDALKNIAKIIETQYELNYIIPLIGEMIDKFV